MKHFFLLNCQQKRVNNKVRLFHCLTSCLLCFVSVFRRLVHWIILLCSLSLSLSLTHARSLAHTHTRVHTHTCTHIYTRARTHARTHTICVSFSFLMHFVCLCLFLSLSLSLCSSFWRHMLDSSFIDMKALWTKHVYTCSIYIYTIAHMQPIPVTSVINI